MNTSNFIEDDPAFPCIGCPSEDTCDGWEARFCCDLCYYFYDDPDCEGCDPMDI